MVNLTSWLDTYDVDIYELYWQHILTKPPHDKYTQRIHETVHGYHRRPFVHVPPPISSVNTSYVSNIASSQQADLGNDTLPAWVGARAPNIPSQQVTAASIAGTEAYAVFGVDEAQDNMRVIYIKVFKVGSSTMSAVINKLGLTRGMSPCRVQVDMDHPVERTAALLSTPYIFTLTDYIASHNNFRNGQHELNNQTISPYNITRYCSPKEVNAEMHGETFMTWCAGYQPWMDYYIPRAWRLVTVSAPAQRLVSSYYWASGYTKPMYNHTTGAMSRHNDDPLFATPLHPKEMQRQYVKTLRDPNWGSCQWHWLCEGTPHHTLNETLQMLRNGAFLVGVQQYMDESLILFRHFMGLFVEDILYFSINAALTHPRLEDWHPDNQARVHQLVHDNGDAEYYRVAMEVFEHQVAFYGGWDKLSEETNAFKLVNKRVNDACQHVPMVDMKLNVQSRTVCLVAQYRKLGLAAQFGEL